MEAVEARLPSELWRWPARDLARGIRLRRISSREVVESCLQRIDKVNPVLNALVEVSREEALARADASDRAVAAGDALGPLHGVPTSIKVNSDEAGHATTNGIVAFREAIAAADAPHVQKLRDAGAVFVGRAGVRSDCRVAARPLGRLAPRSHLYLQELASLNVSLSEALDQSTPGGRALAGMLAAFADDAERDILRDRVRAC